MCVLLGNKLLLSSCLISFFVLAKISPSLEWITLLLGWSGSDSNKHPRAWTHHPQKTMTHICLGRFCCFCGCNTSGWSRTVGHLGLLSQTNSKGAAQMTSVCRSGCHSSCSVARCSQVQSHGSLIDSCLCIVQHSSATIEPWWRSVVPKRHFKGFTPHTLLFAYAPTFCICGLGAGSS